MLIRTKETNGFKLKGKDGEIGKVKEFYFDDVHWAIRYVVVDTGNWLMDKQVLISPYALVGIDKENKHIDVNLTKKQIEDSPLLSSDKPVSLQFELDYYAYYGWPMYWSGRQMWGDYNYIMRDRKRQDGHAKEEKKWDHHLRSTRNVSGYRVQATDGEIGHLDDFIIDDEAWAIRYLVVDTQNWWPGKKVLISPQWIQHVSWSESKVDVSVTRKSIEHSPEYTQKSLITRDYEEKLHGHYNHKGYWVEEHEKKKIAD